MTEYRATIDVRLPDDLEGGTMLALASILLTALAEAEVDVIGAEVRRAG